MRLKPFIEDIQEGVRGGIKNLNRFKQNLTQIANTAPKMTDRSGDDTVKIFVCGIDTCGDPQTVVGYLDD